MLLAIYLEAGVQRHSGNNPAGYAEGRKRRTSSTMPTWAEAAGSPLLLSLLALVAAAPLEDLSLLLGVLCSGKHRDAYAACACDGERRRSVAGA